MIFELSNTDTHSIAKKLVSIRDTAGQMTTSRVLTLIVVAKTTDDVDAIIKATTEASREHPSRVLVMLTGEDHGDNVIDAELRLGGDAGASEIILMRLSGEVSQHLVHVVTPLLLPDTPIVAWWPYSAPANPIADPIGQIAQRRITDSLYDPPVDALNNRRIYFTPGDSDMAWSRLTPWRGVLASALDQPPYEAISAVRIYGGQNSPSVDLAAGWLTERLGVPVERLDCHCIHTMDEEGRFPIPVEKVELDRAQGTLVIENNSAGDTLIVRFPGQNTQRVALAKRNEADCLAEELRHLDPDPAYARALKGLGEVQFNEQPDVIRVADLDAVTDTAAERFVEVVHCINRNGGVTGDGIARIVLTGGGAGIGMLEKLRDKDIDWQRVHLFFGDERNVAVNHPDSNEGQARAALLNHIDIPEENIHGFRLGEVDLTTAATAYEQVLKTHAPRGFDLHLLGMGGEGHINSLFPHTEAVKESEKLVVPVTDSPKPPRERVTLTLPAVATAQRVWLLVAGAEKAEAAGHIVRGSAAVDWPAAGARGRSETLLILADNAATEL
ncbi:oxppcycle protein OpcA [Corynebacterium kutscheri]|uniref:6-phosphogluconolactonase n=1 Tax=Corynebacterium kutscheri TaxID=35755 RepID=A0AB38VTS1_9CORY|nr:oxppcycle protein OpcA [Corynebacterium kutscheri]VEH79683.1 oxppcycle protein OpcA [Corynebacterium kutscheri]